MKVRAQQHLRRRDREIQTPVAAGDGQDEARLIIPIAQRIAEKMAPATASLEAQKAGAEVAEVEGDATDNGIAARSPKHRLPMPHLGEAGSHRAVSLMGQAPPVIARPEMPDEQRARGRASSWLRQRRMSRTTERSASSAHRKSSIRPSRLATIELAISAR